MKLKELNKDFKAQHLALVELVKGDDELQREQGTLDKYDDKLSQLIITAERMLTVAPSPKKVIGYKLLHLNEEAPITSRCCGRDIIA